MTVELRPYQLDSYNALNDWFYANPKGHPLLVLPCGAGKSILNAAIVEEAMKYENQRVFCVSHVAELISQNYRALHKLCPDIRAGIYSASLGKKELHHPVTFASIQSIYKKNVEAGFVNLVIIDEAHTLSADEEGTYRKFLNGLWQINPRMRVIGLTATPWRMRTGLLHRGENAIFTDIAYELPMQRLVKEGWLVRMVCKQAKTQGDTSNLHVQRGDFVVKEAETVFDEEILVQAAVKEMLEKGKDRKTWLIFCVSIKHAEHVAKALCEAGIECKSVSEKTPKGEREQIIQDLRTGQLRAATNVTVLTTGTDVPNIDMVVLLRPTMSPGLFLQMAGRGLRICPPTKKKDCLLLDMAGCLLSHGPITHIVAPPVGEKFETKKKKGKLCPICESVCSSNATECEDCGHIFEGVQRKIKHADRALEIEAMSDAPVKLNNDIYEWYDVEKVAFYKHEKLDKPPTLKVIYWVPGNYRITEWVCLQHTGFALTKALSWWHDRFLGDAPATVDEALSILAENAPRPVLRIKVKKDGKWPEIKKHEFDLEVPKYEPTNITLRTSQPAAGFGQDQGGVEPVNFDKGLWELPTF